MTAAADVLDALAAVDAAGASPTGIRCGEDWFMALVDETAPAEPSDALEALAVIDPRYAHFIVEARHSRERHRLRGRAAWGHPGATLFDVPLVPDPKLDGFEVEW